MGRASSAPLPLPLSADEWAEHHPYFSGCRNSSLTLALPFALPPASPVCPSVAASMGRVHAAPQAYEGQHGAHAAMRPRSAPCMWTGSCSHGSHAPLLSLIWCKQRPPPHRVPVMPLHVPPRASLGLPGPPWASLGLAFGAEPRAGPPGADGKNVLDLVRQHPSHSVYARPHHAQGGWRAQASTLCSYACILTIHAAHTSS